jgi:tetratricopeptide (TPR) repeat protein
MARTGRARRRWITLAIAAGGFGAFLGAGLAAAGWYRGKLVAGARERGFALFDEGRYADALEPLSYYVSRRRSDLEGLIRLGTARSEVFVENNRHLVSAAAFLEAALRIDPASQEALAALLPIYRQLGYRTELLRVADALLAADPDNARALEARLLARIEQGDWNSGIGDAERLVQLEPDEVRWRGVLLDLLRYAERPIDQRIALVDLWIAGGEPDGRYRLLRAEQFMLDGKLDLAQAECTLAAERGISELASLERLVELIQLIGLEDDLERTLSVSREKFGATLIGRLEARLHFLAGRHERSAAVLDELWSGGERSWEVGRLRVVVAELDDDLERSDRAMQDLESTVAEGSAERAKIRLWTQAIRATRPLAGPMRAGSARPSLASRREARETLIRGLQSWPDDGFLLFRHGEMNLTAGENATARQLLDAAFQEEGRRWALGGIRASHAALRNGATDEAFRVSREVVMRHPRNTLAYIGFAEVLSALSREGRVPSMIDSTLPRGLTASVILRQVYETLDRDPAILVPYVAALIDEDRGREALDVAEEAAGREKPEIERICATVVPLLEAGETDGVERMLRRLSEVDPGAFPLRVAGIELLIARNELNLAAERSSELVAGLPDGDERASIALRQSARIATLRSDPQAAGLLSRYLGTLEGDPAAASFVLGQSVAWTDEALVRQAIEHLRAAGGEDSQQVVLAEASRTLAFHRGDAKAIAAAIVSVNQLLRTNPNYPSALIVLARLLSAGIPPDWTRASSFLAKAVDLQPRETSLYPELVILLQKAGNTVDATRYLQQYLRLIGRDEEAARRGARLLLSQGAFVEAIPALERLSGQTGGESDLLAFAEANRAAGRVSAAEAAYREAATRTGRSAVAVQAFAEFLARMGRLEEGREIIRSDAESPAPVLSETDRVIFLLRLESIYGTEESMQEVNRRIASVSGSDPRIVGVLAQQALRRGDDREALRITQEGLERFPEDESLLGMTASLLIADRSLRDRAGEFLDRLGRTRPEWRDLLEVIRLAGTDGEELDLSDATLGRAIELTENHPLFAQGWIFAAGLHVDAGRTEDAIRLARRAVSRLPSDPDIASVVARLLAEVGRLEEAKEAGRAWRRLVPENTIDADAFLANLNLAGDPKESLASLLPHQDMLRSDPERRVGAIRTLVLAQLALGNTEDAAEVAMANVSVGPILAAWIQGARARPADEARAMLDRIPRERLAAEARLGIAAEYAALAGRAEGDSAAEARKLLGELPPEVANGPVASLLRADLLAAEGQREEAVAAFEAFVREIPPALVDSFERSPPGSLASEAETVRSHYLYALNNAASADAVAAGDRQRGLRAIERALRSGKDLVFLLDTRAQLLLATGDTAAARAAAASATSADRNSLAAWLALAEAELAAGRPEGVERALREISRISADSIVIDHRARERVLKVEAGLAKLRERKEAA